MILEHNQGGYIAKVGYCLEPPHPRDWDNVGTVVLHDRCKYNFGDKTMHSDDIMAIATSSQYISLPIYMYDHSGITINTTGFPCQWDSGMVGLIYMTKERAVQEWGKRYCSKGVRSQAKACMKAEIKELDRYVTGEVYQYAVYRGEDCLLDSCGGFYCTAEETMEEAKLVISYYMQRDERKAA